MRANIGFLLIGLGLVGIYMSLGGKFSGTTSPQTIDNSASNQDVTTQIPPNQQIQGGLLIPHANRPSGGGGMSMTSFGYALGLQPMDRYASRGFMK